jgi:hypothetical protein
LYEHNKSSWMDCKAFISWMTSFNAEVAGMGKTDG